MRAVVVGEHNCTSKHCHSASECPFARPTDIVVLRDITGVTTCSTYDLRVNATEVAICTRCREAENLVYSLSGQWDSVRIYATDGCPRMRFVFGMDIQEVTALLQLRIPNLEIISHNWLTQKTAPD